jgi:hypothetical protein
MELGKIEGDETGTPGLAFTTAKKLVVFFVLIL